MGKYKQLLGGKYSKLLGGGDTIPPFQVAGAISTRTPLIPVPQKPPSPLDANLSAVGKFLGTAGRGVSREEGARAIGTMLEVGLPLLAAPLSGGLSIAAAGALMGTGTALKESMIGAATGRPKTIEDILKAGGESALYGMGGQAVGVGIGKLAQKGLAPLAKHLEPQSLLTARRAGIPYLPSEVLKEDKFLPSLMQGTERVVGSTITGGSVLNPIRMGRVGVLQKFARSEADKIIGSLEDKTVVRTMAQAGLKASKAQFESQAGKIYRQLDNAVGMAVPSAIQKTTVPSAILQESGAPFAREVTTEIPRAVETGMLKKFASGIIEKLPEDVRIAIGKGGADVSEFYTQLKKISGLPDNIRFEDAQFYRSQLLRTARESGGVVDNRSIGLTKKLGELFDSRMRSTAAKAGILKEYETANSWYRTNIQKFENRLIAKLEEVEPEALAREIVKPNNAESIGQVRKVIGEAAFQKVKRQGLEDWIVSTIKHETASGEQYIGTKPLLDAWKNLGTDTKRAIFSQQEQREVGSLVESLSKFNTRQQTPGLWGLGQILGGGASAISGDPIATGTIFLGPYVFAKMVSSPIGRKWLTEGFRIKPGIKEAVHFIGRLNGWLAKEANE